MKRILAISLSIILVLSLLPGGVFAAGSAAASAEYDAAYVDSVTVDGQLKENGWLTYGGIAGEASAPTGTFGAMWNAQKLYFALSTADAESVGITVNGKSWGLTLSETPVESGALADATDYTVGSGVVELAMNFSALGFTVENYDQKVDLKISLKKGDAESTFDGKLGFSSVNRVRSNLTFTPSKVLATDMPTTQLGYQVSGNAVQMYDRYMDGAVGGGRVAGAYVTTTGGAPGLHSGVPTDASGIWFEFSFHADSMPVYEAKALTDAFKSTYTTYGLNITATRMMTKSTKQADGTLSLALTNTADGIVLCAITPPSNFKTVALDKQVGDTFHMSFGWQPDGSLEVYVDDVLLTTITGAERTPENSFMQWMSAAEMLNFAIYRSADAPAKEADSMDVTISDLSYGYHYGDSVLNSLDFSDIKGANASAKSVTGDLVLPSSFSDGRTAATELVWSSSNEAVVSNTGKVTTGEEDITVTLTAALKKNPSVKKDITVTVSRLSVTALITDQTMTMDGALTEPAWSLTNGFANTTAEGAPTGALGALWDKDYLYLGVKSADASSLDIKVNGVSKSYTLSGDVFETAIAWSELNVTLTDYGMILPIETTLKSASGSASVASGSVDLILSGKVALNMNPLANKASNTGFTLSDGTISLDGTVSGGNLFMASNLTTLDHTRDMLFEQTIFIEEMPVSEAPAGNGPYESNGYTYRLSFLEPTAGTKWCSILNGSIYNTGNGKLAMTVFCTPNTASNNQVDLGVKVGERFTLGLLWKADDYSAGHTEDNIIEVYVNGVMIKEIAAKNPRQQSYGDHAMVLRYPQGGKVKLSVSDIKVTDPGYTSVKQEFTKEKLLGSASFDNVTADLNLPATAASKYLGNVKIDWVSSNSSVIASDGSVTRPSGKVGAYVTLTAKAGSTELFTVDAYVPAAQSQDTASPVPLWVANSDKQITVDGNLLEEGWLLSQDIFAADGKTKTGCFGAQWKADKLYLAVETGSAATLTLNLNGKTAQINLNDLSTSGDLTISEVKKAAYLELAISFASMNVDLQNYGQSIPASLTLDSGKASTGALVITSLDWFLTQNSDYMTAASGVTTAYGSTSTVTPKQTVTKISNGMQLRDIYDPNGNNPTRIREYGGYIRPKVADVKTDKDQAIYDAYTNMTDRTKVLFTSFDFQAASMPIYTIENATTEAMLQRTDFWPCYGFICGISDEYFSGAKANALNLGIMNTEDGLVACIRGEEFQYIALGKQVGDLFRIGVAWNLDNSMSLYIDGELLATFDKAVTSYQYYGNCSVVFNVIRNDIPAASNNDDFDITVTNVALGHYYSENLLDYLTFDTIRGENEDALDITSKLVLPTTVSNSQFESPVALVWSSTDENVIGTDGTVTPPAGSGKAVTLTATLPNGQKKEFTLFVKGQNPTGSVLCVTNDLNTATGSGTLMDVYQFVLDQTNNSLIYDLGSRQKINVIALHDNDETARLNESVLTIWVSDDNVTYKQVKDSFKLLHNGEDWYLYDFEATGRYIKVHCTHYNGAEADFVGQPDEMIEAYYETVFGSNGGSFSDTAACSVTNNSAETQVDAAWELDLAALALENVQSDYADLRVSLNGELLYHYVQNGKLIVRIPVVKAGETLTLSIQSGNEKAMDISNKEYVHEVVYGTREAYQSTSYCRYLTTLPDGRLIAIGYYYEENGDLTARQQFSSDQGATWSDWEKIDCTQGLWTTDCGGFIVDETTGHLFFHNVKVTKAAEECDFIWIHSTDMGETWKVWGTVDAGIDYMLTYSNGIQLSTYDGTGENVDFAIPLGRRLASGGNPTFGTVVMYSKDAGETWLISEDTVTYGDAVRWESGCSEATLLELKDGRIAMLTRCQIEGVDHFALSYSSDGGIHWSEAVMADSYNPNTQPWLLEFNGSPLLIWGGNNVQGSFSYQRFPMSVAVYSDDMTQVSNIQDLYSRYSLQGLRASTMNKITNQSAVIAGNALNVAWGNNDSHILMMRVDNFAQYLYMTKGAYDSFEGSTAKYEGWDAGAGTAARSNEQASSGRYSLKIGGLSTASRSVPSVQKGELSFDLYVTANSNAQIDLQNAFTVQHNYVSPIAVEVKSGKVLFSGADSGLTVRDGWNSFTFQLDLANNAATLSVNGGEAVNVPVNAEVDDYVAFVSVTSANDSVLYLDEFLLNSQHNADLSKITADDGKDDEEENKPSAPVIPILPIIGVGAPSAPTFTDVVKSDWYYDAVEYVAEHGIMDGVGHNRFAPDATLTRAMVVTILYRMEQEPATAAKTNFTDVEMGLWYSDAVAWAAESQIVGGYGNGKFGPNDPVTREQLAAILYRYTQYQGGDVSIYTPLGGGVKVSDWAKTCVAWAAHKGLFANDTGNDVTLTANRAEVAYAIYLFLK